MEMIEVSSQRDRGSELVKNTGQLFRLQERGSTRENVRKVKCTNLG